MHAPRPRQDAGVVVSCQQLTKTFKDFWRRDHARAVQGLSFDIFEREVFGLLGPNGSGKSTTIKMILGLLAPSSGRVSVFGKLPTDVATKRRIGYLPEESYLYGFLNARETLEYYAKLFELDRATRERRIEELLDMLGLAGAAHRPVREYSKGMQRRIGIAQALINDPDFLILDEPTTGLDPIGTRQIKDLIIELGRRGKTVLLSSHLLADVEDCVDRLVILYGGTKRAEGTCDELLVAQERTTIETDALDDATIAEVDRLVRTRSHGERSVRRVSKPRQSLEALFLDIVERAKAEQVATSGATAGGATASFLRGAAEDGSALIERLVRESDAPQTQTFPPTPTGTTGASPAPRPSPAAAPGGVDDDVIGALVLGDAGAQPAPGAPPAPQAPEPAAARAAAKAASEAVDLSVIGSLLGSDEPAKRDAEKRP
jgi:ABC-2 type transport system ATP-binding protein